MLVRLLVSSVALKVGQELLKHSNSYNIGEWNDSSNRVICADRWNALQNGPNQVESVGYFRELDQESNGQE